MEQLITVEEKKAFLKWFLETYELKQKDVQWLLTYILNDDRLIRLIKFVQSNAMCPRAMVIRTKTVPGRAFLYRKQTVETHLTEKAFHDVRLDQEDPIFVQLAFPDSAHSVPFLSILEDNPYEGVSIDERYGGQALKILEHLEQSFMTDKLNREIDRALEEGDKERFQELSARLKAILTRSNQNENG